MSLRRIALIAVIVPALAACAPQRQALFVVLPNPDGSAGQITVDDGQNKVVLDHAYAASEIKKGAATNVDVDSGQVQQIFGTALDAQPIPPKRFVLLFENNTDIMTLDSFRADYARVRDDIKSRPVYQVEVIGYTDTMGTQQYNQKLSLKRAAAIRDRLGKEGVDAKAISIAGRGKLDLAVATADQVPDPKNRRVVIIVR